MKMFEICYKAFDDSIHMDNFAATSKGAVTSKMQELGNEVIKCTDTTKNYFTADSSTRLLNDLRNAGWGDAESKMLSALLDAHIAHVNKNKHDAE